MKYEIRSIDAWKDCDGWYWNNSFPLGEVEFYGQPNARQVCNLLRKRRHLSNWSKGRVRVVYEDNFIEVQSKSNGYPILALITTE